MDRYIDIIVNRYTKELIYNYRQIDRLIKDKQIDDKQIIDVSIDIQMDRFIVIDRQIYSIVNRYTKKLIYNYRQIDRQID